MADELTLRVNLDFEKDGTVHSLRLGPTDYDVTGTTPLRNRQTIGTSEEAVVVGDAGAGGFFMGINRDDTNFIELRAGSGLADLIKIGPGEPCLFRLASGVTLYAIADTAACELEYVILPA